MNAYFEEITTYKYLIFVPNNESKKVLNNCGVSSEILLEQ